MSTIRFFGFLIATAHSGGCVLAEHEDEGRATEFATEEEAVDAETPYVLHAVGGEMGGVSCGFADACDPFMHLVGDRGTFTSVAATDQGARFDLQRPMTDDRSGAAMEVTMADLAGKWILEVWDEDLNEHDQMASCTFEVRPAVETKLLEKEGLIAITTSNAFCTATASLRLAIRSVERVSVEVDNRCAYVEYVLLKGMSTSQYEYFVAAGTRIQLETRMFDELSVAYRRPKSGPVVSSAPLRLRPGTSEVVIDENCEPSAR